MCSPVGFVIIQLLVQKNWTNAILSNHLHVWLPTELDSTQSCCHYLLQISFIICCILFSRRFIPVNVFLECCILFVCFFWLYYETRTSKLITYFQFVSVVYFLYASSGFSKKNVHQHWSHISSLYLLYTFCTHPLTAVYKKNTSKSITSPVCIFYVYIKYTLGTIE